MAFKHKYSYYEKERILIEYLNGTHELYGVTGNQGINPYATFSDYSQIIDYAKATGDQILAMAVRC